MEDYPKLLDESEVASALSISVSTLQRLIEAGEFPDAVPVTKATRKWFPEDIRAYLYLRSRIGAQKLVDGVNPTAGALGGQAGVKRGSSEKQAEKQA